MKTKALKSITLIEAFTGTFSVQEQLLFGRAGYMASDSWELKVTSTALAGEHEATSVTYLVTVRAEDSAGELFGYFAYPEPGKMREGVYGYGAAGYLNELPKSYLKEIELATGVSLLTLGAEE